MLKAIRTRLQEEAEDGFTLIELLVVVIIIGILAAIAIPTFLNQRERGWEAAAQSDIRNAAIAVESCAVGNNGSYLGCDGTSAAPGALDDEGYNPTDQVTLEVVVADANNYSITASHDAGGDEFTMNSADGAITRVVAP